MSRMILIIHTCLNCKEDFRVLPANERKGNGKYCSYKCRNLSLWKNNQYKDHMKKVHKPLPENIEILKKYVQSEEGKRVNSLRKKGKPSWNKGMRYAVISTEDTENHRMRSLFRAQIQKAVFERDNFTCQTCGQKGGYLHVDHIQSWAEYVELRFSMDNCRTLCTRCHYQVTFGKPMPESAKNWGRNFVRRNIK